MAKPKRYQLQAAIYANVEKWRRLKGIFSEREKSGLKYKQTRKEE